jgi:cysteine desulfurase
MPWPTVLSRHLPFNSINRPCSELSEFDPMIYFDNAATTALDPDVKSVIVDVLDTFGNPSSTHAEGRKARALVESARKDIAQRVGCTPGEIIFTSGGTEADNWALKGAVRDLGVSLIITSPLEHHAVLHVAEELAAQGLCETRLTPVNSRGDIDLAWLQQQLEDAQSKGMTTLVSLMHGNNEIGNLLPLEEVGALCKKTGAYFHSDMVQTLAHFEVNFGQLPVDFSACSAHKFHGPKGIGFAFVRANSGLHPFIHGGSQERGHRSGTENVLGIVGMAKAFALAHERMEADQAHIRNVKQYAIERLTDALPGLKFNGASGDLDNSLYTVLNIQLPEGDPNRGMLTFALDIKGFCVSGGSACSSGSSKGSHVLEAIGAGEGLRLSFSRHNTPEQIDALVEALKGL